MADLFAVADGDVADADDVNQFKTAMEGGSSQQYVFVQKTGANMKFRMATSNGSDRVEWQDSASQVVGYIDSDGTMVVTVDAPTALTIPGAASPSPTIEGRAIWRTSTAPQLTIGDSVGTARFNPVQIVRTTTDFTKNTNDTLGDVTGLSFAIGASEVFQVICDLQTTSNASGGFKVAFTLPSGAAVTGTVQFNAAAALVNVRSSDLTTASGSTSAIVSLRIVATVVNGATAGTVQLQAAQNASHASDSTIYAQSTLTASRIV